MGSQVTYTKGGTQVQCSTSSLPRPRPAMAWPIPAFPSTGNSFLTLTLQAITGSGSDGVLVQTAATLPGNGNGTWTLFWLAYQGTMPTNPTWVSVPFDWATGVNLLLTPMNDSTVLVYLQCVDATQTNVYAQASITTPLDATLGSILALGTGNSLTVSQQIEVWKDYTAVQYDQTTVEAQCVTAGVAASLYTTASAGLLDFDLAALYTYLHTTLGIANPPVATVAIVPTTWAATWNAVFNDIQALNTAITNAVQGGVNNINSADWATNQDKIQLMKQWNDECQIQFGSGSLGSPASTSLDGQAITLGVSHTAYDAAVLALDTYLGTTLGYSTWKTTWPDGVAVNVTGIITTIRNYWSAIAAARTALSNAITTKVNANAAAAAGTSVWGGITGTLASQTDLISKFALYATLAGASFTGAVAAPSLAATAALAAPQANSTAIDYSSASRVLAYGPNTATMGTLNLALKSSDGSVSQTALALSPTAATFSQALAAPSANLSASTASSSTSTGALVVAGGAGIGGNCYVGGNLWVGGSQITAGMATFLAGIQGGTTATTASQSVFGGSHVMSLDPSGNLQGGPGTAGSTTPTSVIWSISAAGAASFTSVSSSGQITSTVATGTAPLVIASTTQVANLNASYLQGATWAAPGAIGGTTPAAISATTGTFLYAPGPQALFSTYSGNGVFMRGGSGSGNYNWQIGNNQSINAALELTPSTAVGGQIFSTPAWYLLNTGDTHQTGGISATTGTFSSGTATSGYTTGALIVTGGIGCAAISTNGVNRLYGTTYFTGVLSDSSGSLWSINSSTGALSATTGTFGGAILGTTSSSYVSMYSYLTAAYLSNWNGSNYLGFGNDNTLHKARIGMVSSTGVWQTAPGDMVLQVDGGATFAGQVQIAGSTTNGQLYLTSNASAPTNYAHCLYNVQDNPWWNGYEILTMGNLNSTAAALMAVQAGQLAPQWVASLPGLPNAQYPPAVWDSVNSIYQGGYVCIISTKAMWQNQGGSWVSVGVSQGIFGQITAGSISAASIGTSALKTQLALASQYISSYAFTSGGPAMHGTDANAIAWGVPGAATIAASTGAAVGFALYASPVATYCHNGWPNVSGGTSPGWTNPTVLLELGGSTSGAALNGFDLGTLSLARLVNGGSTLYTSSTTWTCPPGITQVEILVVAGGGGGAGGATTATGGGGAGVLAVVGVIPGNVYMITVGAGGTGAAGTGGNGTSSVFSGTGTLGAIVYTATGGIGGSTSSGGGISGTVTISVAGGATQTIVSAASGAYSANAGNANVASGILFTTAVSGGGGGYYNGSTNYTAGTCAGFAGGLGYGGAGAYGPGNHAISPTYYGGGGWAGAVNGYNGSPGCVRLRW